MDIPESPENVVSPEARPIAPVDTKDVTAAVRDLLSGEAVTDPTDRKWIAGAIAFIDEPTNDLARIAEHATNIGEVIAGYYMQQKDVPSDIDRLNGVLLRMLYRFHIDAVRTELSQNPLDISGVQHSLALALDAAKILARGYGDTTSIPEIETLRARIDR